MATNSMGVPFSYGNTKPVNNMSSAYDAAASEQAQNYDDVMGRYDNILNNPSNKVSPLNYSSLNYVPINSVFNRNLQGTQYNRSNDLNTAITGLSDYSKTGGYSDSDINNIRERSISPIRSIYDSAQRGLNRQKVLQGGYSPNYGALTAKMARDSSSQIGDLTTRVNADIAQMVASGKLSGLNSLGNVASRDNELMNQASRYNTDLQNQIELMNTEEQKRVEGLNNQGRSEVERLNNQRRLEVEGLNNAAILQNNNTQMNALQGKTSLYETTPALTQTFGNQVLQNNAQNLQAIQTANVIKNQRANTGLNLLQGQLNRPMGGG